MYTTNQIHDMLTEHGLVKNKVSDNFGRLNTKYKKAVDSLAQELNKKAKPVKEQPLIIIEELVEIRNDYFFLAMLGFGVVIGVVVILAIKAGYGV